MDSTSFWQFSEILSSRYRNWMTASIIFVLEVESILHSLALQMTYKFSMAFRSGEFPDQSRIYPWNISAFPLWQGAESFWKTAPPWGRHFLISCPSVVPKTTCIFSCLSYLLLAPKSQLPSMKNTTKEFVWLHALHFGYISCSKFFVLRLSDKCRPLSLNYKVGFICI